MKVADLINTTDVSTDFVVCNTSTNDLPFGIDLDTDLAIGLDKHQIKRNYPHVMSWNVLEWWVNRIHDHVWVEAEVPVQDMHSVVEDFSEYMEELGLGGLF